MRKLNEETHMSERQLAAASEAKEQARAHVRCQLRATYEFGVKLVEVHNAVGRRGGGEHEVLRLDVAVDDARAVEVHQRFQRISDEHADNGRRQAALVLLKKGPEVEVQALKHDAQVTAEGEGLMQGHDAVRVRRGRVRGQRAEKQKLLFRCVALRRAVLDDFERDVCARLVVARTDNLAE
jgi:hypothetical protein